MKGNNIRRLLSCRGPLIALGFSYKTSFHITERYSYVSNILHILPKISQLAKTTSAFVYKSSHNPNNHYHAGHHWSIIHLGRRYQNIIFSQAALFFRHKRTGWM